MQRKDPDVDVVKRILKAAEDAYPASGFIKSLSFQYQERGGLSRKQLQGLYNKAEKVKDLPQKWLATLEAEILKKPVRFKSDAPPPKPLYEKDAQVGVMISAILEKYPAHKRVAYFKARYDRNEALSAADVAELAKFYKLLLR